MPVAERGVLKLRCVNSQETEVDLLVLRWPAAETSYCLAIPCRVCRQGVILAIPPNVIPEDVLEQGQEDENDGMVGPSKVVTIAVSGGEDGDLIEVLLVEMQMAVRQQLDRKGQRSRRAIRGFADNLQALPNLQELDAEVEAWLESGTTRLEEYFTAVEGGGKAEDNNATTAILEQLTKMQVSFDRRFSQLEAKVNDMDSKTGPVARPSPGLPGGLPNERDDRKQQVGKALETARSLLNPPPRRLADEPGGETFIDLEALPEQGEKTSVDDMMKLALMKMLQQQSKTKRKRQLPGLPAWEGESDSDEADRLDWSSSSKGGRGIHAAERLWQAMRAHPEAYLERIEARMMKAVDAAELTPNVPILFAKSSPVGRSRTAGFCLQGFAHIHRLMLENKPKQARLHVVRMMGALEQFLIDENWTVASRLTGMGEPPWGHWATQDLPALRRQFVYSRLAESTWIGALINELKEEEWLGKQRGGLGRTNPRDPKGGKGEGKTEKDTGG